MHRYFAYGSNLVTSQMKRRCPTFAQRPTVVGRATLAGHRLVYPVQSHGDWGGGVAGIEASDNGAAVHGVVYEVDDDALAALDIYEAVAEGLYRRETVTVMLETGEPCPCLTYFAIPEPDGPFRPSRKYLRAIIDGAREHALSADWIAHLEQTPTLES